MAVFVNWKGTKSDIKKLLWNLTWHEPGEDPADYKTIEALVNHVAEAAHLSPEVLDFFGGRRSKWLEWELYETELSLSGSGDPDLYTIYHNLLARKGSFFLSERFPEIRFTVEVPALPCSYEFFAFKGGRLLCQYFENSDDIRNFYTDCRIAWKGPPNLSRRFLKDITAEQKKPDLEHWLGKRLYLENYFFNNNGYLTNNILDGEITGSYISFAADLNSRDLLGNMEEFDQQKRTNTVKELFDAVAAAHPGLEFDMSYCAIEDDDFKFVGQYLYKDGKRAAEKIFKDKKHSFVTKFSGNFSFYRMKRPLPEKTAEPVPAPDKPRKTRRKRGSAE
jgi:hypothetical protein